MTAEHIIQKYDIKDHIEEPINVPSFSGLTGIILIVGSSGSGKSTILKSLGYTETIDIDITKNVIENFSSVATAEKLLIAMGLRSIPTWFRPINKLSNGERHRAECALSLDKGLMFIDEFTSVVDRNTAKSLSVSLKKHFTDSDKALFIASCHHDIEEWLCPDHIYDTDKQAFLQKEYLRRPDITLEIVGADYEDWLYFKKHHYLDSKLSKSTHCYVAKLNGADVAFLAVIHGTGRDIRSYWRESRLVVLPEFQGLGIGKALSNAMAEEYTNRGLRYFSKTAHPALGEARDNSSDWRGTSTNHQKRTSLIKDDGTPHLAKNFGNSVDRLMRDANRVCYSHEFIGTMKEEYISTIIEENAEIDENEW